LWQYKDHLRRPDLAEKVFRKSIEDLEAAGVNNFHYPYKNFGQMLEKNSRTEEAMGLLRKAAEIKKDDGLKIYSELLLPYVYDDEADMKAWRDQFKANVGKLMKTKLHVPDPISMDGVPHYYLRWDFAKRTPHE
jgi:tetratricopeptide (TPR) repeat protein